MGAKTERLNAFVASMPKEHHAAKTAVLFDVMPKDANTDMDAMLKACKSIELDGLLWGANHVEDVAFGIKKLELLCVVEDDKVSIDYIQQMIQEEFSDLVQTIDVAAMNKI